MPCLTTNGLSYLLSAISIVLSTGNLNLFPINCTVLKTVDLTYTLTIY